MPHPHAAPSPFDSPVFAGLPFLVGLCLSFGSFGPAAAFGQTTAGPAAAGFDDSVEVRLVEIEVAVTDHDGDPIEGLGIDDFELRVDGKAHTIDTFGVRRDGPRVTHVPPAAEESPGSQVVDPGPEPLYLAIYVDRNFLEAGDLELAREELKTFLEGNLGPRDQILLAVSGDELEVLAPFGSPRSEVIRKLHRLDGTGKGGKLANDYFQLVRHMRRLTTEPESQRTNPGLYTPLLASIENFYVEGLGEMNRTSIHLSRLIDNVAGLPGRRQILYVGGPIPSADARQLFEVWRDTFERSLEDNDFFAGNSEARQITKVANATLMRNRNFQVGSSVFDELADAASAADVIFHGLGLTSVRRSDNRLASRSDVAIGSYGQLGATPFVSADARSALEMDQGLMQLTGRTGGLHFRGHRKIDRFFDRLDYDLSKRYVIGFYAEATDAEVKVEVKVKKARKRRVRHREKVRLDSTTQLLATRTRSALLDLSDIHNPLDARVSIDSVRSDGKGWVVAVTVSVPIGNVTLVDDGQQHAGRLWIYAAAGDPTEQVPRVMRTPLNLSFPAEKLARVRGQRAEYSFQLAADARPTRLAVTVRDDFAPAEATVGLDLTQATGGAAAGSAPGRP